MTQVNVLNQRVPALDGLRGIAVLLVLLSHSSNEHLFFHPYINIGQSGRIGVFLFFILSAYLLDRQIIIALQNGTPGYWPNYFLRRFLRIYPLFFVALLFHFLLTHFDILPLIPASSIMPHLLLQEGKFVFWSIPVEFKYYLLSPMIMLFCHYILKWNAQRVLLFLLSIIALSIALHHYLSFDKTSTIRYLPVFITGTLLSIYEFNMSALLTKHRKLVETGGVISILVIAMSLPFYFHAITGIHLTPYFQHHPVIFYVCYSCLWATVLVAAKYGLGYIHQVLAFKPLRFVGRISFSLYLFHYPILLLVVNSQIPEPFKIYSFVAASVIVSYVTYLLIEKPLMRIRISQTVEASQL